MVCPPKGTLSTKSVHGHLLVLAAVAAVVAVAAVAAADVELITLSTFQLGFGYRLANAADIQPVDVGAWLVVHSNLSNSVLEAGA